MQDTRSALTLKPVSLFSPSSASRVTVLLLTPTCDLLCMGTEGGGVHFVELPSLTLLDKSLLQEEVLQR